MNIFVLWPYQLAWSQIPVEWDLIISNFLHSQSLTFVLFPWKMFYWKQEIIFLDMWVWLLHLQNYTECIMSKDWIFPKTYQEASSQVWFLQKKKITLLYLELPRQAILFQRLQCGFHELTPDLWLLSTALLCFSPLLSAPAERSLNRRLRKRSIEHLFSAIFVNNTSLCIYCMYYLYFSFLKKHRFIEVQNVSVN